MFVAVGDSVKNQERLNLIHRERLILMKLTSALLMVILLFATAPAFVFAAAQPGHKTAESAAKAMLAAWRAEESQGAVKSCRKRCG